MFCQILDGTPSTWHVGKVTSITVGTSNRVSLQKAAAEIARETINQLPQPISTNSIEETSILS
jgi:hypothetical protein